MKIYYSCAEASVLIKLQAVVKPNRIDSRQLEHSKSQTPYKPLLRYFIS